MSEEQQPQFAVLHLGGQPDPSRLAMTMEQKITGFISFIGGLDKDQLLAFRDAIQFTIKDEMWAGIFIGMASQRMVDSGLNWIGEKQVTPEEFIAQEKKNVENPVITGPEFGDSWGRYQLIDYYTESERIDRALTDAEELHIDQWNAAVRRRIEQRDEEDRLGVPPEWTAPRREDGYLADQVDENYTANLLKYHMEIVTEKGGRVRCLGCKLEYISLADRMIKAPDDCHGCREKAAHG